MADEEIEMIDGQLFHMLIYLRIMNLELNYVDEFLESCEGIKLVENI